MVTFKRLALPQLLSFPRALTTLRHFGVANCLAALNFVNALAAINAPSTNGKTLANPNRFCNASDTRYDPRLAALKYLAVLKHLATHKRLATLKRFLHSKCLAPPK